VQALCVAWATGCRSRGAGATAGTGRGTATFAQATDALAATLLGAAPDGGISAAMRLAAIRDALYGMRFVIPEGALPTRYDQWFCGLSASVRGAG
jgi:hypothetical protein